MKCQILNFYPCEAYLIDFSKKKSSSLKKGSYAKLQLDFLSEAFVILGIF